MKEKKIIYEEVSGRDWKKNNRFFFKTKKNLNNHILHNSQYFCKLLVKINTQKNSVIAERTAKRKQIFCKIKLRKNFAFAKFQQA